jgi:hypothetical protein
MKLIELYFPLQGATLAPTTAPNCDHPLAHWFAVAA